MQTTIKTLLKKGYSQTYIAKTLHVSRKTIRKIIQSEERGEEKIEKKPHPSMLDQHREFIEIQLNSKRKIQPVYNYYSCCCKLLLLSLQDSGKSVDQGINESSTF